MLWCKYVRYTNIRNKTLFPSAFLQYFFKKVKDLNIVGFPWGVGVAKKRGVAF